MDKGIFLTDDDDTNTSTKPDGGQTKPNDDDEAKS